MATRFSAEDAVILVLEQFGQKGTAFIESRTPFKRETVYRKLVELEKRGIVERISAPFGENTLTKDGRTWKLPPRYGFHKNSLQWRLKDGQGRPTEDPGQHSS